MEVLETRIRAVLVADEGGKEARAIVLIGEIDQGLPGRYNNGIGRQGRNRPSLTEGGHDSSPSQGGSLSVGSKPGLNKRQRVQWVLKGRRCLNHAEIFGVLRECHEIKWWAGESDFLAAEVRDRLALRVAVGRGRLVALTRNVGVEGVAGVNVQVAEEGLA